MHIFLNDEDVTQECNEACPGSDGFIVYNPPDHYGKVHYCYKCSRHICTAVKHGLVRVEGVAIAV